MVKKYILLTAFTTAIIAIMFNLSAIVFINIPYVKTTKISQQEYSQKVYVNGKIEEINKSDISYDIPIVAEEIYVKEGTYINAGDIIGKIDVTQTKNAIVDLLSLADILPEEYAYILNDIELDLDIEKLSSMIPTDIVANYSGVVSSINTVTGAVASPKQTIATISDLGELQAKISVAEEYASSVFIGQKVSIYVDALDEEYEAIIKSIAPIAHEKIIGTSTQTVVNVSANIIGEDSKLKPGYNVSGEIEISTPEIIDTIAYTCINQDENNLEYVYVYENGKAVKRYIKTGVEFLDYVQIIEGITTNDIVIADNMQITHDNQSIQIY